MLSELGDLARRVSDEVLPKYMYFGHHMYSSSNSPSSLSSPQRKSLKRFFDATHPKDREKSLAPRRPRFMNSWMNESDPESDIPESKYPRRTYDFGEYFFITIFGKDGIETDLDTFSSRPNPSQFQHFYDYIHRHFTKFLGFSAYEKKFFFHTMRLGCS